MHLLTKKRLIVLVTMSQISAERRYDLRDRGVVFIDGESSDQTIQRFNVCQLDFQLPVIRLTLIALSLKLCLRNGSHTIKIQDPAKFVALLFCGHVPLQVLVICAIRTPSSKPYFTYPS